MAGDFPGGPRPSSTATRRHGLLPLSANEVALYAGRDEAARRRRRLLDVRERERRIARQVTRRYRDNLARLRGDKARDVQLELRMEHEALLSELGEQYQQALQSMGTAHRDARDKQRELAAKATDEAHKWRFNALVVAKHRSGEAIRSRDEDERARLARRWEAEQNLGRLRDLADKQQAEASEHARREREAEVQRVKEAEEAEKVRRENAAEEVVTRPRPYANDVVSYHFTRLHCLSADPATTLPIRGRVKVVRHNPRHPSAKSGVEEAAKHREEVDKRLEQRRREDEENKDTANARGADAMEVVASRKGGEKAIEWLASIDKMERKVLSPDATPESGAEPVSRRGRTPESVNEKGFAQLFRIHEEDSGELSVFSAGSEHELDDDDMTSLSSTGEEVERVKLKAHASFPFDVTKPSALSEPHSDQPVSSESEEESEGDARLELLKDFLEATTKMKQGAQAGEGPTPDRKAQEDPNFSWQLTGKRHTGQRSAEATPRATTRPRDERGDIANGANAPTDMPAVEENAALPSERQRVSDRVASATDAHTKTMAQTPAPSLGQREEHLSESDSEYTEQDSIELLEDRLQEVLNLRLRRSSPAAPQHEEQREELLREPSQSGLRVPSTSGAMIGNQGRLRRSSPATLQHEEQREGLLREPTQPGLRIPSASGSMVEHQDVASEHYESPRRTLDRTSEGGTSRHQRRHWSTDERASSLVSADADISSSSTDDEDEKWGFEGDSRDLASSRPYDATPPFHSPVSGGGTGVVAQQQGSEFGADSPPSRVIESTPKAATQVSPSTRHSPESLTSAIADGHREAGHERWDSQIHRESGNERWEPQTTTGRSSERPEDIDAFYTRREHQVGEALEATSEYGGEPENKLIAAGLGSERSHGSSADGSSHADLGSTRGSNGDSVSISRERENAALSRSMLSDDVETVDGHQFVQSELKSARGSARYAHSLSSSSNESPRGQTSAPRMSAALGSPSHDPVNAYTDRVRRARRSSTGSSIAQYSLPASDLHSSFDGTVDGSRMDEDDGFVNDLVPMFPNHEAQRQHRAVHGSEGGTANQYNLPPDESALSRVSIGSSASSDVGTQLHPLVREQGLTASQDRPSHISRRSSGRFEMVDDARAVPQSSKGLRGPIIADNETFYRRRGLQPPGGEVADPTSAFTQYDLPDESDGSSVDAGSLASSRVGSQAFRPSDSGSSHSSIGFAVQLALASGTPRRHKGDAAADARQWSQSRIAPMHTMPTAGFKRGVAELYSRRYSSDSSTSADDHLRYMVSMTAIAGDTLPLPLHLPPRVFGEVDMSKPPVPMQLMESPALSSSSTPSGAEPSDSAKDGKQRDRSSRSSSPRSSWSASDSTNEVYARLQAMKLRALPAARFQEFDMRQPPAPAEGFFRHSSSSVGEKDEGSDGKGSQAGSVPPELRGQASSQQSHRSSWSGSEASGNVIERLDVRSRGLPAPSFAKGFDMSQPPAPMHDEFEQDSHSSVPSKASSLFRDDEGDGQIPDSQPSPRVSEIDDDVFKKLEAINLRGLPAPPSHGLDMSQPPAPMESLFKQYSLRSSSSDASGISGLDGEALDGAGASSLDRRLPRDFEEEEEKHQADDIDVDSASDRSFASSAEAPASKNAASLYVPVGESGDGGDGASLAEAFQKRHPRFHQRAEQHRQELERRRQQHLARQHQRQQAQQTPAQTQEGGSKRAARASSVSGDATLSEEKQQMLGRLAAGARAKVSDREMKERSRRLYQQLPEVIERRRQEEVLRRRRERLNELREQEKARRQAQRERRQQQQSKA